MEKKRKFYLKKYFYHKFNENGHKQKKYFNKIEKNKKSYKFNVREPWFSLLKNGEKNVEGRLNVGVFSKLSEGDIIEWNNAFRTTISKIVKYKSFKNMIETEGLNNVLPHIESVNEGVNIYRQFYSEENENKYGVIAIHLILL